VHSSVTVIIHICLRATLYSCSCICMGRPFFWKKCYWVWELSVKSPTTEDCGENGHCVGKLFIINLMLAQTLPPFVCRVSSSSYFGALFLVHCIALLSSTFVTVTFHWQSPCPVGRSILVIRQMVPQSTTRCAKHYTDDRPATQTTSCCPWSEVGACFGRTYLRPKDSDAAVILCDRATPLEGYDRQSDKQTNKLFVPCSKIILLLVISTCILDVVRHNLGTTRAL